MKAKKISVRVLARHIKKGVRGSFHYCPIARALRENGHKRISVSVKSSFDGKAYRFVDALTAGMFMVDFDKGLSVSPFTVRFREAN